MDFLSITSKKIIILFAIFAIQFSNNNSISGQTWSLEYDLSCDSTVYSLSQDKIIQGKAIEFFFPAYKYYQTSSTNAIEAVNSETGKTIEIECNSKRIACDKINFDCDLYAEGIDSIQIYLKDTDDRLILMSRQASPQGYTYIPSINFSVELTKNDFKSLQIVGESKNEDSKFILGRLIGSKKIEFKSNNVQAINAFVSKYPTKQQGDLFYKLSDPSLKIPGFGRYIRLVLKNCHTIHDSILCISQFTDKLLNEYKLYDAYNINKSDLLSRNALLTETTSDIKNYYKGLKEIIALMNCCHERLTTNQTEDIESPSQPIYFYQMNNNVIVSAIFDLTLVDKIHLGDQLISINNVPISQLYKDFSKDVFASTPQQREMKITQRLLFSTREMWGDSVLLKLHNDTSIYSIYLSKAIFSGKRVVPQGFKVASNNMIEKYNHIIYLRPVFTEALFIPFMYSHQQDFINCRGLIVDLRGNPGGDLSGSEFFSFLISKDSPFLYNESNLFNVNSYLIIKPSNIIHIQAPIVVIIDARTTCMGELLINALRKNRPDVCVIGASNTAGSGQRAITIDLPQNAFLTHFVGITKDAFGNIIDDNIGIKPDSLIRFDSYLDLFPYNDKLKNVALDYLSSKISKNENVQY